MHVLQYLAVKADSTKEAYKNVKSHLENVTNGDFWSDWHVVGGGRWSKNSKEGYDDSPDDVISYVNDNKKFLDSIEWTKKARMEEMKGLLESLHNNDGEAQFIISALAYAKKAEVDSIDMNSYLVNRISKMLLGIWTSDSFFFDAESNSCSYVYLQERIEAEPDNVYLVPVDFHF